MVRHSLPAQLRRDKQDDYQGRARSSTPLPGTSRRTAAGKTAFSVLGTYAVPGPDSEDGGVNVEKLHDAALKGRESPEGRPLLQTRGADGLVETGRPGVVDARVLGPRAR